MGSCILQSYKRERILKRVLKKVELQHEETSLITYCAAVVNFVQILQRSQLSYSAPYNHCE